MRRGIKSLGVILCSGMMVSAAHAGISVVPYNTYTELNLTNVVDALQFRGDTTAATLAAPINGVTFDPITADGQTTTAHYGTLTAMNIHDGFLGSHKYDFLGTSYSFPADNSDDGATDITANNNPLEILAAGGWTCGSSDAQTNDSGSMEISLPVTAGHIYDVQLLMVGFQPPTLPTNNYGNYTIGTDTANDLLVSGSCQIYDAVQNAGTDYSGIVTDQVVATDSALPITIAWDQQNFPSGNTPYIAGLILNDLTPAVPEPASLSLIGIAGLGMLRRRVRA